MKVAIKALFSRLEIFLIKNNRRFVIDEKESLDKDEKKEYKPKEDFCYEDETFGPKFETLLADTGLPVLE